MSRIDRLARWGFWLFLGLGIGSLVRQWFLLGMFAAGAILMAMGLLLFLATHLRWS
jgi:hypothetical protein